MKRNRKSSESPKPQKAAARVTKAGKAPKAPELESRSPFHDQASTGSAGGRDATFESSPIASTPADPVDDPDQRRRPSKARPDRRAKLPTAVAADPDSAEQSSDPKKALNDHIICEHPPAIDVDFEKSTDEDPPASSSAAAAAAPQGVAQLEERAVGHGEAAGSRPAPLIEQPRGNSNGDATHLVARGMPPAVTPSAGGAPELQPTLDAEVPIKPPKRKIVKIYEYTDEEGVYLYEVCRYSSGEPRFLPRHRVDGKIVWGLTGVRKVPYRLHDYAKLDGQTVFVVEGEKDVDTARNLDFIATCSSGGANGWHPKYAEYLHKHRVVIIPDNDDAGEVYADAVATSIDGIAVDYRIVRLPDLPPKGDLTDFIERGGTKDDILALVEKAFAVPRLQTFALYDTAADTPGRTNGKPSQPIEPSWSIVTKCFADIEREEINWLWKGMWINHTLNMLIGPPGVGKTFVACHLAAAVSSGAAFPDEGGTPPIGDVVYCCTEDSLSAAIRPRLEEAGAKIERCHTWLAKERIDRSGQHVEEPLSLTDVEALIAKIDEMPDLRLVIFDPVMAYMGNAEANDNQDVRRILEGLRKIAESKRICVLLVSHLKKGVSQAINATMGAQAFTAVPRSVYMVQKDPEDPEKRTRCLSPVKNNSGPDKIGKKFRLDFGPKREGYGHIVWDAVPDERSADEISMATIAKNSFTGRESNEEKSQTKNELAFFDVLDALSDPAGTWVPSSEIKERLGWNGGRFASVQWQLERSGRVEVRKGEKPMPGGGVQRGGRDEVRRPEIVVPWSPE